MGFGNQQLMEGTNDRYRVEYHDGLDTPIEELELLAERGSDSNIEVEDDKIIHLLPEYDPEMDRFDGEVNYDEGVIHRVSMVGHEYARGYQTRLTELKNPAKREIHAANVRKLGGAANKTKLKLAFEMLFEGDSAKHGECYDGQMFFDGEHPGVDPYGNSLSQRNLYEDLELTRDNLILVLTAMTNYCNAVGQPFGNSWTGGQKEPIFRLWHGPANENRVAQLKLPDPVAQNPLAGTFVPQKSRYFRGPYAQWWMVQFLNAPLPIGIVDIEAYLDSKTDRGEKKVIKHVAHAEFAMGYMYWHGVALCRR